MSFQNDIKPLDISDIMSQENLHDRNTSVLKRVCMYRRDNFTLLITGLKVRENELTWYLSLYTYVMDQCTIYI